VKCGVIELTILVPFRSWNIDTPQQVTDPHDTLRESTGPVASDSLAADSIRAEGEFSKNPGNEPWGVKGENSTFANTNTSGATRLHPASDAEARMAEDDWAEEKKLGTSATSYPGAANGQSKGLAVEDTRGSYQTGGSTSNAGTAPSYVNSQFVNVSGPKGKNLTEGGFESNDRNNASFNSEIGSRNDPGRVAEAKFQRENADSAFDAGVPRQGRNAGDTPYDALDRDTEA